MFLPMLCDYVHLQSIVQRLSAAMQAQPEVLFEATLAEGQAFKVTATLADHHGFSRDTDAMELEFR